MKWSGNEIAIDLLIPCSSIEVSLLSSSDIHHINTFEVLIENCNTICNRFE